MQKQGTHLDSVLPNTVTPESEDDVVARNIETLLNDPTRVNVHHSFSLHNMTSVTGGLRLHLVLKFKYHEDLLPIFGAAKPEHAVEKRYGEAHRLFPYCIFNSIEETPISWTVRSSR